MKDHQSEDPSLTEDQKRLALLATIIDGIGDIDFHEKASRYAGDDREPKDYEYYLAVCDGLDSLL